MRPAQVEEVRLCKPRRLLQLRGTREELMKQRDSTGDAYLRIEIEEKPAPGLADEIREAFPNAVEVRVVHQAEESDRERIDLSRTNRSPGELFGRYLKENGIEDQELTDLFNILVEEEYAAPAA